MHLIGDYFIFSVFGWNISLEILPNLSQKHLAIRELYPPLQNIIKIDSGQMELSLSRSLVKAPRRSNKKVTASARERGRERGREREPVSELSSCRPFRCQQDAERPSREREKGRGREYAASGLRAKVMAQRLWIPRNPAGAFENAYRLSGYAGRQAEERNSF